VFKSLAALSDAGFEKRPNDKLMGQVNVVGWDRNSSDSTARSRSPVPFWRRSRFRYQFGQLWAGDFGRDRCAAAEERKDYGECRQLALRFGDVRCLVLARLQARRLFASISWYKNR
jgi:hypothetical protein